MDDFYFMFDSRPTGDCVGSDGFLFSSSSSGIAPF